MSETASQPLNKEQDTTLESAQQSFKEWRESRKFGERIPEHLWDFVVALTDKYPPGRISRVLSLNYVDLKRRVQNQRGQTHDQESSQEPIQSRTPSFIELKLSGPSVPSSSNLSGLGFGTQGFKGHQFIVELSRADGSNMKIYSTSTAGSGSGSGSGSESGSESGLHPGSSIDITRICESFLKS